MRLAVLLAASLACVGIGFAKSAALSAHVKDLETLQKIIQYLRGEIVTAASPLPDAFWETGRRMRDPYRDFLQDISEDMRRPDGKTLPAILEENTAVHLADTRLTKEEKEEVIENCQFVVRKLAHFSIYAILGINILGFFNTYKNFKFKSQIEITLFSGFLYAVSDEFHQMFSGGRTASPKDVCIDTLGVLFGIGIFLLIKKLIKMTYTKSYIQNK